MTYDYDLVVIGASPAGMLAARLASQWRSRVALVTQNTTPCLFIDGLGLINSSTHPLPHIPNNSRSFGDQVQWISSVSDHFHQKDHPDGLLHLGVDVIHGSGCFQPESPLKFTVTGRTLCSRRYLLASSSEPTPLSISGLKDCPYFTPQQLCHLPPQLLNELGSIIMVGNGPMAVVLAQVWRRGGCQVVLVPQCSSIIPTMDEQVVSILHAQLEADGIEILSDLRIETLETRGREIIMHLHDGPPIQANALVVVAPMQPVVEPLNLSTVGVKLNSKGCIQVNHRFQTNHPQIYACGNPIDGQVWDYIACHEATIAVRNALFGTRQQVDYGKIPKVVWTDPPLVTVGLTPEEAKKYWYYGQSLHILVLPYDQLMTAHFTDQTTGLCQMVVRDQILVGCQMIGAAAVEFSGAIALAIQHRLTLPQFAQLALVSPTYGEILHQTAMQWYDIQASYPRHQRWLETFFNWRRTGYW